MTRIFRSAAPPLLAALLFSTAVTSHTRVSTRLSWKGDIGRIVQARCVSCHTPPRRNRQPALPDLRSYTAARPWARAIREATLEGHAAPWNGGALTSFERELLVQWIDGGAPETVKAQTVTAAAATRYVRIASGNPAASLDAHQTRLGGTREVIAGLGLSLRTPSEILVFDRSPDAGERIVARGTIVPSLAAHLASLPTSVARTRVSDAAFIIGSATDPRVEVAEIPAEGPDRFWCTMHPDVRSAAPGTCPRCAMTLVEMAPLSLDTFKLEVVKAEPMNDNIAMRLTLRVTRGAKRTPVTSFVTTHERPFHLFVIDANGGFEHLHPEVSGNDLVAFSTLPWIEERWVIGDFVPLDAMPQTLITPLPRSRELGSIGEPWPPTMKVSLDAGEPKAGELSRVAFALTDRISGAVPSDLEPYLGAPAHLFVIDEEKREPMHAHPVEIEAGGPAKPAFDVRFPRAGRYRMWLQTLRAGRVETFYFIVDVSN